jgi:hypothetical protein
MAARKRKGARQGILLLQAAQKMPIPGSDTTILAAPISMPACLPKPTQSSSFARGARAKPASSLDDVPTFRIIPPLYYYLGRAQEGLKSPAAADSYKTFHQLPGKRRRSAPERCPTPCELPLASGPSIR